MFKILKIFYICSVLQFYHYIETKRKKDSGFKYKSKRKLDDASTI